jgi:hypothetical protein
MRRGGREFVATVFGERTDDELRFERFKAVV